MLRTNLSFYLATHVEIEPRGGGTAVSGGILKSVSHDWKCLIQSWDTVMLEAQSANKPHGTSVE